MQVAVIAVGRLKTKPYRKAANDYIGRLDHYGRFSEVEVRSGKGADPEAVKAQEAESLLAAVPHGHAIVALDERGKQVDSEAFARDLERRALYGRPQVAFLIGGAFGLDASVRERADMVLSLSRMTLPHELARVMLWEQLYRAMTITRNEPYHK